MKISIRPPKLADYQSEILYNDSRFTITEASTKVGKTFSHIWWIFRRANESWNQPGFNHWWVAPVYGVAKIAFNFGKGIPILVNHSTIPLKFLSFIVAGP